MTNVYLILFAVTLVVIGELENRSTRKALTDMSIALDNLTAQVAALETTVSTTVSAIGTLHASGEDTAALDALSARVKAASDSLTGALAPKTAPSGGSSAP